MKTHKGRRGYEILVWVTVLFFLVNCVTVFAQETQDSIEHERTFRVMFYNVENLFDVFDDTLTNDDEFTPGGARHWNNKRFYTKINSIAKVIMAAGQWSPPSLVGLCEIENRFVLERLVYETPLARSGYKIVHHESPDHRGIDVALLYRDVDFEHFSDTAISVGFAWDTASATRDILYVKGLIGGTQMLHIFVNHWPSRFGGFMNTIEKRNEAARLLKRHTDSLFAINPGVSVVIMGDFNDDPADESISSVLGAKHPEKADSLQGLYNLMLNRQDEWPYGSLKYRESWNTFDQIIVSGNMLLKGSEIWAEGGGATVFHVPFLLEDDETFLGIRPYRTFNGYKYQGGFSDHLPVYFDLMMKGD